MIKTKIVPNKPALILEDQTKSLVLTDLHIGFETNLTTNKIFLGKNTTIDETITDIEEIIDKNNVDSLILLGDVKSSISSISKSEWNDIPKFFKKMMDKVSIILIPGNHDANIQRLVPEDVSLISSTGMVIENILLTHGHTMPSENFSHINKIIMGHIHPVFFHEDSVLNGQRVWISLKTKKQTIFPSEEGELEITIVPSFNKYFYATHKKYYKKSISPILEKIKDYSSARIVTLDGTIIGDERSIDQIL